MRTLRPSATPLLLTLLTLALPACGDDEADEASEEDEAGEQAADEGGEKAKSNNNAAGEAASRLEALSGIDRFKHWSPLHAFLNSPATVADVISDKELIVATRDAHVGVSKDSGETWTWTKASDEVVDVAGYAGGPYALLHEGAVSISDDGLLWRRLPRWTEDSLFDLVAAEIGLVAIAKDGAFVHFARDGSGGFAGQLPDKFEAKAITELNGAVLAWSGKRGYGTTDGRSWTELETLPEMPDGRTYLTSAGSCTIGRVSRRQKGVVCSVSGTAHGLGDDFAVASKGVISLTTDGGETWTTASLPFRRANAVFGTTGGPYYAIGDDGAIAISKDGGETWVDQKWEESADLIAGLVDGDRVIIVGNKSTIVYSTNGGSAWEYAMPPVGKNFDFVAKVGDRYVISDGRAFVSSTDAANWVEAEAVERPGKPDSCPDEGPADGEACRYDVDVTTPEGVPDVRALTFEGDVGIALGDDGLVAVSSDGGASWSTSHGLEFGRKGATSFSVEGEQVLATEGSRLLVSTDAGDSWDEGEMVGRFKFEDVHITKGGVWLAVARDAVLAAKVDPKLWLAASEDPLDGRWQSIFEVAGTIFIAGERGELLRSEDGESWAPVVTGLRQPVVEMVGEGETVWAATEGNYKRPNVLLHSQDGGAHFAVASVVPEGSSHPDLSYEEGVLGWRDLASRDQGKSWRHEVDNYLRHAVDVADGSGMKIASPGRLYLSTGPEEGDWTRIDSAFSSGGEIQCDATSGCWILSDGVLYRPLGR